jgi:hypothetical protein
MQNKVARTSFLHFPIIVYAVLSVIVFPVFPHFVSPNEFTRWALAAAIVEDHSIEITRFVHVLGDVNFEDAAERDGHLYSNKAPGAALVGVPGYAAARMIVGPPTAANMRFSLTAMRLLAATIPLLVLAFMMARVTRRFGASEERARATVTILLFATPLFAYGLLNFSHALTAAAIFAAWVMLFIDPSPQRDIAAGALIGLSTISEYPMAIAGAVLLAVAWRRVHRIVIGGLPFALLLAIYNRAAFGSAFALSSGSERNAGFRELASGGVFGVGIPSLTRALRLLFDPSRGLFVFSPVLLLALIALWRRPAPLSRSARIALIAVPASLLILYSGYPNWHGGWSVGPRYLVPAVPFLLMPIAFLSATWIESLLAGAAVAAVALISLTFPFPDVSFLVPWQTLGVPLLREGLVAPNALHLVARALAIFFPFALVALAILGLQKRWWIALGAGLMIGASAGLVAMNPPTMTQRLRIGYIEQVYFERRDAMQRALPPGAPLPARALERARYESTLPPASWPF